MPRPSVREVIVEAALAEFHRGGFTASSVDTITRAAGVPKGSFYNHFRSKEELAALIVGKYAEESEWRHDRDPAAPPLARLRARFETMGAILVRNGFTRGCLLGNMAAEQADHSEQVRAEVHAMLTGWGEAVAALLVQARERGELTTGADPARLARFLLDAWEGALLRARAAKDDTALADFFTTAFEDLLR